MQNRIDTLIFDLGGVLIDWNPVYVFRQIFDDEQEMQYFLTEVCSSDWNVQQDAGRPLAEATETLVKEFPHYEAQIRAYYGRWEEMLGGPIDGTVDILEQLHAQNNYRLLALTNWSDETFPVALERYDFLQRFEGIVVSGAEKLKKPDPAIYRLLLERYEVDPSSSLFIDDLDKNVAGAKAVGINAVQFHSPQGLRTVLQTWGIM